MYSQQLQKHYRILHLLSSRFKLLKMEFSVSVPLFDANFYDFIFIGVGILESGQKGEATGGNRSEAKPEEGNRASASRKREEDEGSQRIPDSFEAGT